MTLERAARAVLISGCSSGIGAVTAAALSDRGYRVFATARRDEDVARLDAQGLEALPLDVADSGSIQACVAEVLARTQGRLYGLFNNAGYGQPGALEDLSRQVMREQFETNVLGLHELTSSVLPAMRAAGEGRIIHHSSLLGFISLRYRGAYQASKHAVEALGDTLRQELHGSGIHVSLIEPGPIVSRFRENAYAAFKRHVDVESSPHRDIYRQVERRLAIGEDNDPFTLPETAVFKKVLHALESARPRPRYYVTLPAHVLGALRRALSSRMLDRLLLSISRAELR